MTKFVTEQQVTRK